MNLQEKIKERAYALYLERGSKPGHAQEDWARAEKEITEQFSARNREKTGSQQPLTAQTNEKTVEQPRQEPATKQESKQLKKNSKPQDAFLFSSGKQNVRSLLK